MELDHIVQAADGGPDIADNAIPVCFDCHAEIHSYNNRHPKGRKLGPEELLGHKEQWLAICRQKPDTLLLSSRNIDVGPLQAVINELEFNLTVMKYPSQRQRGCPFRDDQFSRAISEGALWTLEEDLKAAIIEAYVAIGRANQWVLAEIEQHPHAIVTGRNSERATEEISAAGPMIENAYRKLCAFLQTDQQFMSPSEAQKLGFLRAIQTYSFPPDYFNFSENVPEPQANTSDVERKIQANLCSGDWQKVKDGLSKS